MSWSDTFSSFYQRSKTRTKAWTTVWNSSLANLLSGMEMHHLSAEPVTMSDLSPWIFFFLAWQKSSRAAASVQCPNKGHEQPPSPHKAVGTAAAMSKCVDFAQKFSKKWPFYSNQEGMAMLCNSKSFISFSVHSNNMSEQYKNIQPKYFS